MVEVEPQPPRLNQRTPLWNVLAQNLSQSQVQQVGSRVIAPRLLAGGIYRQIGRLPDVKVTSLHLTDMQHASPGLVVCSTHVHLTAHTCMEVLVLRGEAAAIRTIADKLIATRGVQHGKLTMTTLGRRR